MITAYLNRIGTAVPDHDVHGAFVAFADARLADGRTRALFRRMAERGGIAHRYSPLDPGPEANGEAVSAHQFYRPGAFPGTAARMAVFAREAPRLALGAVERLGLGGAERNISHVVVVTCTGFTAPGLDQAIVHALGLPATVERTMIGFMGCAAAINALRLARHIVRSEPAARVLVVAVELCSLHLQDTGALEQLLSFLIFGDGAAAALVSAAPAGLALERFETVLAPDDASLITWEVGDSGFDMALSGQVPAAIGRALKAKVGDILAGAPPGSVDLWAVHPGGRSVLDAVEAALALPPAALDPSRAVLHAFGNMSSATILFVLDRLMAERRDGQGCAMAFGPGLAAETMLFRKGAR